MTFVSDLRTDLADIRSIPNDFGLRPYSVAVRVSSWTGPERGDGNQTATKTETTTSITEGGGAPPKVRWLSNEQLALSGAEFGAELIEVGPITPDNTLRSALEPSTSGNDTVEWVITGPKYPSGAAFTLRELKDDRGLQFTVVLKKTAD